MKCNVAPIPRGLSQNFTNFPTRAWQVHPKREDKLLEDCGSERSTDLHPQSIGIADLILANADKTDPSELLILFMVVLQHIVKIMLHVRISNRNGATNTPMATVLRIVKQELVYQLTMIELWLWWLADEPALWGAALEGPSLQKQNDIAAPHVELHGEWRRNVKLLASHTALKPLQHLGLLQRKIRCQISN